MLLIGNVGYPPLECVSLTRAIDCPWGADENLLMHTYLTRPAVILLFWILIVSLGSSAGINTRAKKWLGTEFLVQSIIITKAPTF